MKVSNSSKAGKKPKPHHQQQDATPLPPPSSNPIQRTNSLESNKVLDCIATTLSCDYWVAPLPQNGDDQNGLGVNHFCMHPDYNESPPSSPKPDVGVAARFQEVFIDLVVMKYAILAANSKYVFDPRFDNVLSEGDKVFRDSLFRFVSTLPPEARCSNSFESFQQQLGLLGFDEARFHDLQKRTSYISSLRNNSRATGKVQKKAEKGVSNNTPERFQFPWFRKALQLLSSQPKSPAKKIPGHVFIANASPQLLPSQPKSPTKKIPGHVFIANASVCEIYCDSFLIPASIPRKGSKGLPQGTIFTQYKRHLTSTAPELYEQVFKTKSMDDFGFSPSHGQVTYLKHWPFDEFNRDRQRARPFPFFGDVAFFLGNLTADRHISALVKTATHFVDLALTKLRALQKSPLARKLKYVLAIPVIGTGGGGGSDLTGDIISALLETFTGLVRAVDDLDIILVCADSPTFAQAQVLRRDMIEIERDMWPSFDMLSDERKRNSDDLSSLACKDELSLFLGAGVSMGSGGMSWFALLENIEKEFITPGQSVSLGDKHGWDAIKMADDLEKWCEEKDDNSGRRLPLKARVAMLVDRPLPSLLACLLASLGTNFITQNYDRQIEAAIKNLNVAERRGINTRLSVIPFNQVKGADVWVLKMHGCVTAVDDIVLTSKDFSSYENSRLKALGGIVQSELIKSHLLFVGFSMSDPNYLRIIEEVRQALGGKYDEESE